MLNAEEVDRLQKALENFPGNSEKAINEVLSTKYNINEDKLIGKGISYCTTCDGMFFKDKDVLVVGDTNKAIEKISQSFGI